MRAPIRLTGLALTVLMGVSATTAQATAARASVVEKPAVVVQAVQSASDLVSLVAEVRPMPVPALAASAVNVSAGGNDLPTRVSPLLPSQAAVSMVVDASAAGRSSLEQGGQAGIAGFLLQMPPDASTVVVADRTPPAVVSRVSAGIADDLSAASALDSHGARSTSAALTLAVNEFPAGSVIALYTSAPDAGGESAASLADRLRASHAVLAVVNTSRSSGYWAQVAEATGGLAITTRPSRAINAFDVIADSLRSRYLVAFARPVGSTDATMRVKTGKQTVSVTVPIPAQVISATTPKPSSADPGTPWWLWAIGGLVLVIALAMILYGRREPRSAEAFGFRVTKRPGVPVYDEADVQVFEGEDLFEPRAERDAREAYESRVPGGNERASPSQSPPPEPDAEEPAPKPKPEVKKYFDVPQGPRHPPK